MSVGAITRKKLEVCQKPVRHLGQRIFVRLPPARLRDSCQSLIVVQQLRQFSLQRLRWLIDPMIEDKARLPIADEIMEAVEVGNEHGTSVRHRFQRREPKRFAGLR